MGTKEASGKGVVSEIQRFSVHDGPGIRTLIFLKGCPLHCKWCCNPENQSYEPEIMAKRGRQETIGRWMTVEDVLDEIRKDRIFYRRSGGGITFSGGEALCQAEFVRAVCDACKEEGITTAIETTGCVSWKTMERAAPGLDLMLYDIKHTNDEKHRLFTGVSNRQILENFRRLAENGYRLIVRVPVIPGFNDTGEEICQIARFAASCPGVKQLHLLPYHRLGEGKYAALGREYELAGVMPLSDVHMETLLSAAQESGLNCQIGG